MPTRSSTLSHVAGSGGRVLLLCHGSVIDRAVSLARAAWPQAPVIDVLAYGWMSPDRGAPPGARLITVVAPAASPARALHGVRLLGALRRQRFDVVAISQPSLRYSRARGLLLALPFLLGARSAVLLPPEADGRTFTVTRGHAAADLVRWALLRAASGGLAAGATTVLRPFARLGQRSPATVPNEGRVVYLRTDLDLIITPLIAGGSLAHTDGVIGALLRRGYEVEFWSTGDVALNAGVPRRHLPAFLRGNVPQELAEVASGLMQGFAPSLSASSAAVVYQRYSLNNLAGLLLARRWRVPLILEANCSEVKWRQDWSTLRFPRLARACERLLLSQADRVSTVSKFAAEDLVAAGADPARVRIVPNAVDYSRFAHVHPRALPFEPNSFVIGFCGLFYPWHGVCHLVDAFTMLHPVRPDARLLLVGDGQDAPLARARLEGAGCHNAALLPGMVHPQDIPGYLAACDVLVSPHADVHRFIGSPIKLFEYMASGKAIVASAVAQIAEVLRNGENALLVAPEDPAALCGALERLHDDPALRSSLGSVAQREAHEIHSWDARVRAIIKC